MPTAPSLRATLIAALFGFAAATPLHAEEERVLNIANWAEYIGETTVRDFERETGIRVRYDTFDSNEVLLAKIVAGRTGYDIVVPSSDFERTMIEAPSCRESTAASCRAWST